MDLGEFLGWCMIVIVLLAIAAGTVFFGFFVMPHMVEIMREERAPPTVESKAYNGTLGMFSYGYSWWGLGHVESTRLTFVDGQVFSFSGELHVVVGQCYMVQYYLVTYYDNSTKVEPKTVVQIAGEA